MNESTNTPQLESTVLSVGGTQFASEQKKVAAHLEHQPDITAVELKPVSQTVAIENRRHRAHVLRTLDVPAALQAGRSTLRTMHQNLAWAVGYNVITLPTAARIFEPRLGLQLRPEWGTIAMTAVDLTERTKTPTAERQTA